MEDEGEGIKYKHVGGDGEEHPFEAWSMEGDRGWSKPKIFKQPQGDDVVEDHTMDGVFDIIGYLIKGCVEVLTDFVFSTREVAKINQGINPHQEDSINQTEDVEASRGPQDETKGLTEPMVERIKGNSTKVE